MPKNKPIDNCTEICYYFLTMEYGMRNTQPQIMSRIAKRFGGSGAVVTAKDFLDLAGRDAVDQALRRLSQQGDLRRIGRGLYHMPRINSFLGIEVPPDADTVADAIGRQTGDRIAPSPAVTANRLGLSTQIPAKLVYLTTGRSKSIVVGSRTFYFRHVSPHKLPDVRTAVGRALQAIDAVGPEADTRSIHTIRSTLTPSQRRTLRHEARYSTGWVAETARRIDSPEPAPMETAHG